MSLKKLTDPNNPPNITVVVPTIREECWQKFFAAWEPLFRKHKCTVLKVEDGDVPSCSCVMENGGESDLKGSTTANVWSIAGLIVSRSPACRNLGFFAALKIDSDPDVIMTFDDDTEPSGDTIYDHLVALDEMATISWFPTATYRMRGYPFKQWLAANVYLSHGYWRGVPDYDAVSQLSQICDVCDVEPQPVVGVIPQGVPFSMCGMNIAFRVEALPYIYYAPVVNLPGAERFDDIWAGLYAKREFDKLGWAVTTGRANVVHTRASNVFKNLRQEAVGIEINETLWQDLDNPPAEYREFFEDYARKRAAWRDIILRALAR